MVHGLYYICISDYGHGAASGLFVHSAYRMCMREVKRNGGAISLFQIVFITIVVFIV